jgi:amino acid transporter
MQSVVSLVAFQAMVSIATIGLYIAYALPSFFRITLARKSFVVGPFNLGSWGVMVGWVAVLWVAIITILFSLPTVYPVTAESLNYTPVVVGSVSILIMASWLGSAKFWFKGPVANVEIPPEVRE